MITQQFIHDVAEYTNNRVTKVVLNGTYEITKFTVKQVSANTLILNYIVPLSSVPIVTKIELKDAANNIISTNQVDVPIVKDTLMIQTIEVKEV